MRCVHESKMHEFSSFVTLTYDDEHVPTSLRYSDFQKFMKRVRKKFGPTRFFMCGEYGENTYRPHFHACLFGVFFVDRTVHSVSGPLPVYRSATLEQLWPFGFSTVGDVTFESAAYCARYVLKKVTGARADEHYKRVDLRTGEIVSVMPEFCRMSLKPGIGATWFAKYHSDVYSDVKDGVPINGVRCKPPRYYDRLLEARDSDLFEYLQLQRYLKPINLEDQTDERLAVREKVALAKVKTYQRSLD